MAIESVQERALHLIRSERCRQDDKWGLQQHDPEIWLTILAEEVGEASEEVLTRKFGKVAGNGHGNLTEEVVHVAAVAVAWLEALLRSEGVNSTKPITAPSITSNTIPATVTDA